MSASRPEADTEYSRGPDPSEGRPPSPQGRTTAAGGTRSPAVRVGTLCGGLLGAGLLLIAEFTPLLTLHSSARSPLLKSISTGSHHSFALVPVALLTFMLTYAAWGSGSRLALPATGVMGLLALAIAVVGDLPDAQSTGLVATAAASFATANASPDAGLYLETLGAIVLLVTAGAGLLLGQSGPVSASRMAKRMLSGARRSAS